eukprot:1113669-Rhodomonas_salina.1
MTGVNPVKRTRFLETTTKKLVVGIRVHARAHAVLQRGEIKSRIIILPLMIVRGTSSSTTGRDVARFYSLPDDPPVQPGGPGVKSRDVRRHETSGGPGNQLYHQMTFKNVIAT